MSFGDFASMFSKMKESFSQAFNLKSINKEIKTISEQFQSLIKLEKEKINEITNYREYELNYSPPLNNNENKEITESNNILYLALVSFHQKKGSVVELTYPSFDDIKNNPSNDLLSLIDENSENNKNIESIINTINSQLINYSLMDGIHLMDNDTQIYFLHNLKKPIYCLSYYVQVKTGNGNPDKEDSFQENVRECIQKAICIVSLKPIFTHKILYQNFYTHLKKEMDSFMDQKSLNDKTKLDNLYKTLSQDIIIIDSKNDQWLFNIRKLFFFLKNDLFNIIKLILCEQNILIFSQIPSNVSLFIISLLYILPSEISQILSNYEYQNATPFKLFHKNYLIYPLFCLFDLTPLTEKMKSNPNLHYICGTTNFLVAKSKDINYACFIDLDELCINYNENIESNLISNNSIENKIIEEINKEINSNMIKEGNSNKYENNKKYNIEEDWILDRNKCREDYINEHEFIIKKIREYIMSIAFDVNYLMNEIKYIKENNDENKATIKMKKINEDIYNNYFKFINAQEENPTKINPEQKSTELSSSNSTSSEEEYKEDFLPRIDELISEPYIFLLNSKLSFSINNQIDMGIIASPQKTDIPKDLRSPLSDLNILYFVSQWLKTKNFQNWYLSKSEEQNNKITKLSPLNSTKALINKLYDYENNEYNGTMVFGKKNGKGKVIYVKQSMIYVGVFINDSREMKGNISSFDNKYLYDGEWKNDKFEGSGSLVTPDGNKYVGQFKNGLFEGKGYFIDHEGNIYDGNFKNGKKWGEGELSMTNGNKYIGMFKEDKFNGKGKMLDKDGNILQEGNFKDGIFVPKKRKDKDKTNGKEDVDEDKTNDVKVDKNKEKNGEENGKSMKI